MTHTAKMEHYYIYLNTMKVEYWKLKRFAISRPIFHWLVKWTTFKSTIWIHFFWKQCLTPHYKCREGHKKTNTFSYFFCSLLIDTQNVQVDIWARMFFLYITVLNARHHWNPRNWIKFHSMFNVYIVETCKFKPKLKVYEWTCLNGWRWFILVVCEI